MIWDHEKERLSHGYSQDVFQERFYSHKYLFPRNAEVHILQDVASLSSVHNHLISVWLI